MQDLAKLGDKVACSCKGGPHSIVSSGTSVIDGIPVARVGDMSSCGASIVEGHSWFTIDGAPAAVHGSQTSCGGSVVASSSANSSPPRTAQTEPEEPEEEEPKSDILPGITLVREAGTRAQVKQRILPSPSAEVSAKFDELNTHLPDYVLPGTLVVLSDPENTSQMCTQQEEELRQQAVRAQQTVQWLEPPEAQALVDHYGPLRDFSLAHNDEMSDGSTWVGVASAAGEHFMETVQKELEHIHSVYVSASERMSARFEAMRQSAFKRIDAAGDAWTNVKLEIVDDASDLKGKIGVAGGVAVSKTQTALKSFIDYEIPSVSEAIGKAGVVVKGLSLANYAAVIVDYYATDARVAKACSESRESECMRVTVKEYGGLMGRIGGGTLGSIAGGAVDARYGQVLCGVVGVHPAGRLVCGAAVIGSGAYFGGATGGDFLGGVAERVYLQVQDDDKRVDNADD